MTKRMTLIEKVDALILREIKKIQDGGDYFDNLICPKKREIRDLYSVLSAIRGPDQFDAHCGNLKIYTTAVIRAKMPGLSMMNAVSGGVTLDREGICFRCLRSSSNAHFVQHVEWAAEALDIHDDPCPNHIIREETAPGNATASTSPETFNTAGTVLK